MPDIRQLTYQPPRETPAPVETMSFGRLRQLNDGSTQRGDFHVVAMIRRGPGQVSVDFSSYPLVENTVVWIRPGVVHRWAEIAEVAGDLVLFEPTAPVTPTVRALVDDLGMAACWSVGVHKWRLISAGISHLKLEADSRPELLSLLLSALLLRLDPRPAERAAADNTFGRFRIAVEEDFRTHHDVAYYGHKLNFSAKTLTRSTLAATGRSAKDYISERLILEAKRLLAHERLSPTRCGERLGFRDASNFSAFFVRETGMRPGAWQAAHA